MSKGRGGEAQVSRGKQLGFCLAETEHRKGRAQGEVRLEGCAGEGCQGTRAKQLGSAAAHRTTRRAQGPAASPAFDY